jgi:hypothetical protein
LSSLATSLQPNAQVKALGRERTGNAFVVYEISRQVLPTAPSPTITHLIASCGRVAAIRQSTDDVQHGRDSIDLAGRDEEGRENG